MTYLFENLDALKTLILPRQVALFLDYDGTLTPIADTPDQAVLSKEARDIVEKLSKRSSIQLAVISGRALEDVRHLVAIHDLIYVGNHGFEIQGGGIAFEGLISPEYKKLLDGIKEEMGGGLAQYPGVYIEDKGITLSIHFRQIKDDVLKEFESAFHRLVKLYLKSKSLRVTSGKKVFEIRPPMEWDKGKAVTWILKKQQLLNGKDNILPIYIGDDSTDEDAFAAIRNSGLTIYVGTQRNSQAQYFVRNPQEVLQFLDFLSQMLS